MMQTSQTDLGRCPRLSRSQTSNTYLSFTDHDLCSKANSADPLVGLNSDNWKFCEKSTHRSEVEANSLPGRVDLVGMNLSLKNSCRCPPVQNEVNDTNLATYLKAFALIYVLPEVDWTAEKIDMLLAEGTDLFGASSDMELDQEENKVAKPEINTNAERIKRKFNLEGHTFTLALEPCYLGEVARQLKQSPKYTINNLRCVLQSFFKSARYCLLLTRVGNLLVWRRRKVFFVLNVKGNRMDALKSDKDQSLTKLVCLKSIDNVVDRARNLRGIRARDTFSIRELVVMRLETPSGRIYMRDSSCRSNEQKVVNKNYAYLKATLHLSLKQNDLVKNRSGLMVAVGSILASKVYDPSNWDTNMLDRLVCYGVELCRSCWSDCLRDQRPIDLDTFPTQLRLGQFVMELKLVPNVKTGHWQCGICIIGTSFEAHVREAFKNYSNVVFQINSQMYAMWTKGDFYYLLDPYQHSVVGTNTAKDKSAGAKWATLRMFRDQLTLLSVFHQLLKESNKQSSYYMHVVRIRNLAECPKRFALAPLPENVDTFDVESLNEPILFCDPQGISVSEKFQKEISDFEDEEKLRIFLERQNAEARKNVISRTKVTKQRTKKRRIVPTKSKTQVQDLQKAEKKHLPARKKSAVVIQEAEKKNQQNAPRRMNRKAVKPIKNPANSVASSTFSRQKGGRALNDSPASPRSNSGRVPCAKWSGKSFTIMKIGDTCCRGSELRIVPKEGPCISKDGSIKQADTVTPPTAVRDVPRQSQAQSKILQVSVEKPVEKPVAGDFLPRFPGFSREPQILAVAGSESGTVDSLKRLLASAFKVANRVLTMTPWGNYVIFRHRSNRSTESAASWFYLFDGCTCDVDRFRHLDLSKGTAGLVAFRKLSDAICHIIDMREKRALKTLRCQVNEKEPVHSGASQTIGSLTTGN